MIHRPRSAPVLIVIIVFFAGCTSTSDGHKWSYSRQSDSAQIVVSRSSPGDCQVAVDSVDGRDARFVASSRQDNPPLNQGDFDWPLSLPAGAHELALVISWTAQSGSFRYTPTGARGEFFYERNWSDGATARATVTAVFRSGHSYRLYALHKKEFEVALWDITADPLKPTAVQTWVVPVALDAAYARGADPKVTLSN